MFARFEFGYDGSKPLDLDSVLTVVAAGRRKALHKKSKPATQALSQAKKTLIARRRRDHAAVSIRFA